jgi:hypothetical protein
MFKQKLALRMWKPERVLTVAQSISIQSRGTSAKSGALNLA